MAAGIWLASQTMRQEAEPLTATVLPSPMDIPEFTLLDHNGNAIDQNAFKGQWDLVFFGFTHCPDICPLTLQTLASAQRQLADTGHTTLPRIVLVSVDPDRDTPETLSNYIGLFGEDSLGITGDIDEIRKLTGGLGIFFEKHAGESENYSVDHSSVVLLLDPSGRFHALFSSPHKTENFVADLPQLLGS